MTGHWALLGRGSLAPLQRSISLFSAWIWSSLLVESSPIRTGRAARALQTDRSRARGRRSKWIDTRADDAVTTDRYVLAADKTDGQMTQSKWQVT